MFDKGGDMHFDDALVNYAVIAQVPLKGSDLVGRLIDVNCGKPVLAAWDRYKKWLSRFAPSALRARAKTK